MSILADYRFPKAEHFFCFGLAFAECLAIIVGSRPSVCPQLPCKMSGPDILFTLRNNFYLGAYQAAIAEAADLERLSEADSIERDCFVYRSYVELGSYEVSDSSTGEGLCSPRQRDLHGQQTFVVDFV